MNLQQSISIAGKRHTENLRGEVKSGCLNLIGHFRPRVGILSGYKSAGDLATVSAAWMSPMPRLGRRQRFLEGVATDA
jgi:hypothetical protein